jgi:hypothetical protein
MTLVGREIQVAAAGLWSWNSNGKQISGDLHREVVGVFGWRWSAAEVVWRRRDASDSPVLRWKPRKKKISRGRPWETEDWKESEIEDWLLQAIEITTCCFSSEFLRQAKSSLVHLVPAKNLDEWRAISWCAQQGNMQGSERRRHGCQCLPESTMDDGGHGGILRSNSSSLVAEMGWFSRGNGAVHRGLIWTKRETYKDGE